MPTVDGGIQELTEWIRANEHQTLDQIVSSALQRGFTKRVINAALQAYLATKATNHGNQGAN